MDKTLLFALGFIMVLLTPNGNADEPKAIVDRIESNYAVVEFSTNDTHKMLDIPIEDINNGVAEGTEIPVFMAEGKFYTDFEATDYRGIDDTYYQFRSDDNEVWWALTAKDIGFTPDTETQYILYFTDNGTTPDKPPCDCPAEYECECYCYDDIFFGIEAIELGDENK